MDLHKGQKTCLINCDYLVLLNNENNQIQFYTFWDVRKITPFGKKFYKTSLNLIVSLYNPHCPTETNTFSEAQTLR